MEHAVQPAIRDGVADRAVLEAQVAHLIPRDHPVLPIGYDSGLLPSLSAVSHGGHIDISRRARRFAPLHPHRGPKLHDPKIRTGLIFM